MNVKINTAHYICVLLVLKIEEELGIIGGIAMSQIIEDAVIQISENYLYIPIWAGACEKRVCIYSQEQQEEEQCFEFLIPIADSCDSADQYSRCDFWAEIPVKKYIGKRLILKSEMTQEFVESIRNEVKRENEREKKRPVIHFTTDHGWTNDPNGLVYADGVYHFYFQYNPFNTGWNNMSWGHAVSKDLIHWTQKESVMFPDENGTMFSGCGIKNDRGMLDLPKEALIFYYTQAGSSNEWSKGIDFTQRIAYSLDGGETLIKMDSNCIDTIEKENRDPKVFWHNETDSYIMVLWLEKNDFAIFRSKDMLKWEQSDRFTLEDAWECPDLFCLESDNGEKVWFFWSADGFYYSGNFDGYKFVTDGTRKYAYANKLPYAAQTYSGVEDRIISIPWIRMENDGRKFTGTYGIPVTLSCVNTEQGYRIVQRPVPELFEETRAISYKLGDNYKAPAETALVVKLTGRFDKEQFVINGSEVVYDPENGDLSVGTEKVQVEANAKELMFIVDDKILEVFVAGGVSLATFILENSDVSFSMNSKELEVTMFEIQ